MVDKRPHTAINAEALAHETHGKPEVQTTPGQAEQLDRLQAAFAVACSLAIVKAAEKKISNRVRLHYLAWYTIRKATPGLGSQMACNACGKVARVFKTLMNNRPGLRRQKWPQIGFKHNTSVHYDKHAYSLRGESVSPGRSLLVEENTGWKTRP